MLNVVSIDSTATTRRNVNIIFKIIIMQSDFVEEYVKSEYSVHPSIFKLHDMPSYNPE